MSPAIIIRNFTENSWSKLNKMIIGGPFGPPIFFSEIWLHQSLNIMVRYYYVQYHKKLKIQSRGKLVTVGREDRRTRVISKEAVRLLSSVQSKSRLKIFWGWEVQERKMKNDNLFLLNKFLNTAKTSFFYAIEGSVGVYSFILHKNSTKYSVSQIRENWGIIFAVNSWDVS